MPHRHTRVVVSDIERLGLFVRPLPQTRSHIVQRQPPLAANVPDAAGSAALVAAGSRLTLKAMSLEPVRFDLRNVALGYHRRLPQRIREYLEGRGIPDELIDRFLLGWNGQRITIPVANREGLIRQFRLGRDPQAPESEPKMLTTKGATMEVYGWETLLARPQELILCEGEYDRLVLLAHGFKAVTSTGGVTGFSRDWVKDFALVPELFVCFDRDQAGEAGARRVASLLPEARIVKLPEEVGEHGDVTDYFVRLGHTAEDFRGLLAEAAPLDLHTIAPIERAPLPDEVLRRVAAAKAAHPITSVVEQLVELRPSGTRFVGRCPLHDEREPSLVVYPATNTFCCFGCGKGGDALTFLRLTHNLTFQEALQALENWSEGDRDDGIAA